MRQTRRRAVVRWLAVMSLVVCAADAAASSLSVDGALRYAGSYGLQVVVDDSSPAWVQDDTPAAEKHYRVRFYVRLNGLTQPAGSEFDLFSGFSGAGVDQLRVMAGASATGKQLRLAARRDDGGFAETPAGGELPLARGWRAVEIEWKAASAPGANDGTLAAWIDGQAFAGLSGLDNDLGEVSRVRWGAVAGLDTGTAGSFRLDAFESRRELRVGLLSVFTDVPPTNAYWRWVLAIYGAEVTSGCGATTYCPANPVTREQMSIFLLRGREGGDYTPGACVSAPFADVPVASPFCRWIRELAERGVTSGCGAGNYCPKAGVTRAQMAVFLLLTAEGGGYAPPACTSAPFADVPAASGYCRWIQELVKRGVTSGCGGGKYCPNAVVTRGQMAVFLSVGFGLPVPVP